MRTRDRLTRGDDDIERLAVAPTRRMPELEKDGNWEAEGLCRRPENRNYVPLFFEKTAVDRRPARNLCQRCPVRRECLSHALEEREIWGVWGGCDEGEIRRALQVDAKGKPLKRCRFPQCPFCHSRPSRLFVVSACTVGTGRQMTWVECRACLFRWSAPTAVTAVRAYWRERRQIEQARVQQLQQAQGIRARAASGRISEPRTTNAPVPVGPGAFDTHNPLKRTDLGLTASA